MAIGRNLGNNVNSIRLWRFAAQQHSWNNIFFCLSSIVRAEEVDALHRIVKLGLRWKKSLAEILGLSSTYFEKDLTVAARALATVSKVFFFTFRKYSYI